MNRIIVCVVLLSACTQKHSPSVSHEHVESNSGYYYTCSMHPDIREDKPGNCPICSMRLTKVEGPSEKSQDFAQNSSTKKWYCRDFPDVTSLVAEPCPIDGTPMIEYRSQPSAIEAIAEVTIKKSQKSHFKPSFFPVTPMTMTKNIRLLGSVLQSEDRQSAIPARVEGRVEKVYVKSTGSFIKKGDPVLELYSPTLMTAGQEYIVSRKSFESSEKQDFEELLIKATERLKLWGVKSSQYESWYTQGKVPERILLYSPSTGIVQKHHAKVGRYFKEGENFFELSDLSEVWVELDVYEQDSSSVKLGQKVSLEFSSSPGVFVDSEIDFIAPILDTSSRTLKVRTTVANKDGSLKPGMISEASLTVSFEGKRLVVPRTAVIDTGKRKVVWVKVNDDSFQAKVIQTGIESEGYIEIKDGLKEDEQVVIDGNFLLDAQAQLFGGYSDLTNNSTTSFHD